MLPLKGGLRMPAALERLTLRRPRDDAAQRARTSLCFSVTQDYPDTVLWSGENRIAGRRGQQNVYALLALNLCGSDLAIAESVKSRVIEALSSGPELPYSKESISKSQRLAQELLAAYSTKESKELLAYLVAHDTVGFGPFSILLEDQQSIEEIVVNSPTAPIGIYHSTYGYCTTNLRLNSERDFRYTINKMISATDRELNSSSPIIDAQLGDGSRVHAQLKPYSISGALATIRINGGKRMDLKRLMELGTVTPEGFAYLWLAIESNLNIVISGSPASGKTSLLMALNALVPRYQRVITIEEDINELKYYSNFTNVVALQGSSLSGRPSLRDQVVNALHLRPDRLILGEIRGNEAGEVLSGSNYGIPFMTTMHSSDNGSAIVSRLQAKPMSVEPQLVSMLDCSVFMRQKGLQSRVLESIVEYRWLSRDEMDAAEGSDGCKMQPIIKDCQLLPDALTESKVLGAYGRLHALRQASCIKELRSRATFLKGLALRGSADVAEYIARYGEPK